MRVVHATDIHWFVPPTLGELGPKRILGGANLFLAGRVRRFDREAQRAIAAAMRATNPDLALVTGDLTAMSLDAEFALARAELEPLLADVPALVIPGNHDVYTRGVARDRTIERYFGDFMALGEAGVARLDLHALTVIGLDPNRPTGLDASGSVPEAQLSALPGILADPTLVDRTLILAIHYPLLDRKGGVYDNARHGLLNGRALLGALASAPRAPDLIVHGHIHRGYAVDVPLGSHTARSCNPGTGGYACDPTHRHTAAFNVYDISRDEIAVERWLWDGAAFAPETGGAYASGW